MTKSELIKSIEDFSDDTIIYMEPFESMFQTDVEVASIRAAQEQKYKTNSNNDMESFIVNIPNSLCFSKKPLI